MHAFPLHQFNRHEILDTLDRYLERQEEFDMKARSRIEASVHKLPSLSPQQRLIQTENIVVDYLHINADSALRYLDKADRLAAHLADSNAMLRLKCLRLRTYPIKGMLATSLAEIEKINVQNLPDETRGLYFRSAAQIFDYAHDMYEPAGYRELFRRKSRTMADSVLRTLDTTDREYKYYKASRRLTGREGNEAVAELIELLDSVDVSDYLYARMAAEIGNYYLTTAKNNERASFFYALSAISDIITGNTETTSLHRLGKLLYENGDIDRAMNYLNTSLKRSVESGARIRLLEIAEALPIVMSASAQSEASHRSALVWGMCILAFLALLLIVLVGILWQQRDKLRRLRRNLDDRHRLKDEYIRELLSLCAVYLSTLNDVNRLTARKLKAKQYADLLDMIESGKVMRHQLQTFHEVFDSAFLKIYPHFINGVNSLLMPDRRFDQSSDVKTLSPELRLLAFMRLGIDDSAEIAKFLGLSVNTVYAYRNKLKSRAINRLSFDADIMNIDEIS